jgi:hypothetical protein
MFAAMPAKLEVRAVARFKLFGDSHCVATVKRRTRHGPYVAFLENLEPFSHLQTTLFSGFLCRIHDETLS